MTCAAGRVTVSQETRLRLFSDAAGRCQDPSCLLPIFTDVGERVVHFGEVAHIIAANASGPRADRGTSRVARAQYENLILLCANTHTVVDKAPDVYPVELLRQWKRQHVERIDQAFGVGRFESRAEARSKLETLVGQNRTVFDQYGPETDHRFNPESPVPTLWRRHVLTTIVPNNRAILRLLEMNAHLLLPSERSTVDRFRIHVRDLEARHVEDLPVVGGARYPAEMDELLTGGEDA